VSGKGKRVKTSLSRRTSNRTPECHHNMTYKVDITRNGNNTCLLHDISSAPTKFTFCHVGLVSISIFGCAGLNHVVYALSTTDSLHTESDNASANSLFSCSSIKRTEWVSLQSSAAVSLASRHQSCGRCSGRHEPHLENQSDISRSTPTPTPQSTRSWTAPMNRSRNSRRVVMACPS